MLLKSDPLRPLGVAPKLADFGLSKVIRSPDAVVNHSGAGTITHLAPEMLTPGTRLTTAVDVFAFGVLMWEFYTARRPFAGLGRDAIADAVLRRGARPAFPPGAPRAYVELAAACWAPAPGDRPSFADVGAALHAMADAMAAHAAAAAAAAAGAQAPAPAPALPAPLPLAAPPAPAPARGAAAHAGFAAVHAAPPTLARGAPAAAPGQQRQQQPWQQQPQQQQQPLLPPLPLRPHT